jgi:hypothetical protein
MGLSLWLLQEAVILCNANCGKSTTPCTLRDGLQAPAETQHCRNAHDQVRSVCYLAAGLHSCRMRVDVDLVCRFPVTVVRARCWVGLVSLAWTVADGALAARDGPAASATCDCMLRGAVRCVAFIMGGR